MYIVNLYFPRDNLKNLNLINIIYFYMMSVSFTFQNYMTINNIPLFYYSLMWENGNNFKILKKIYEK